MERPWSAAADVLAAGMGILHPDMMAVVNMRRKIKMKNLLLRLVRGNLSHKTMVLFPCSLQSKLNAQ